MSTEEFGRSLMWAYGAVAAVGALTVLFGLFAPDVQVLVGGVLLMMIGGLLLALTAAVSSL